MTPLPKRPLSWVTSLLPNACYGMNWSVFTLLFQIFFSMPQIHVSICDFEQMLMHGKSEIWLARTRVQFVFKINWKTMPPKILFFSPLSSCTELSESGTGIYNWKTESAGQVGKRLKWQKPGLQVIVPDQVHGGTAVKTSVSLSHQTQGWRLCCCSTLQHTRLQLQPAAESQLVQGRTHTCLGEKQLCLLCSDCSGINGRWCVYVYICIWKVETKRESSTCGFSLQKTVIVGTWSRKKSGGSYCSQLLGLSLAAFPGAIGKELEQKQSSWDSN